MTTNQSNLADLRRRRDQALANIQAAVARDDATDAKNWRVVFKRISIQIRELEQALDA